MNGIEALQAMKEGKIVSPIHSDCRYRMIDDVVQRSKAKGEWERCLVELNNWMDMNFELSSEPIKYDLTFFEAMSNAFWGEIVCNEAYPTVEYRMKMGVLYWLDGVVAGIQPHEMKAKWRVVKEEEE